MVNEKNIQLIENKKPFETVQEIDNKYKVLSLEEFMKTYESDKSLEDSYNNEISSHGDIGNIKGYGPCSASSCPYSTSFRVNISTSGSVWWGRRKSASGMDPFPESVWKWSPTNSYLYTDILKLDDIRRAKNAISWIDQGALYIVNCVGGYSFENDHHKRETKDKLREVIEKHERGESVSVDFELYNLERTSWVQPDGSSLPYIGLSGLLDD